VRAQTRKRCATLSLSLSLSLTHTHIPSLTHSLAHSLTHSHSLAHTHTRTHTHTHTHTPSHADLDLQVIKRFPHLLPALTQGSHDRFYFRNQPLPLQRKYAPAICTWQEGRGETVQVKGELCTAPSASTLPHRHAAALMRSCQTVCERALVAQMPFGAQVCTMGTFCAGTSAHPHAGFCV